MPITGHRRASFALALVSTLGCAQPPAPAQPPVIVGAWRSSVRIESGVFATMKDFQFLYVFNVGGTLTESSNYDEVPPVPPAYGEWRETGANQFEAKYTFFTTSPPKDAQSLVTGAGWAPAGHGTVVETIRLGADGRTYESTITIDLFDTAGKPVEGGGRGTARGARAGF